MPILLSVRKQDRINQDLRLLQIRAGGPQTMTLLGVSLCTVLCASHVSESTMAFTSEEIAALMNIAKREWSCRIRLKITAGFGCTVIEVFDRDAREPSVPIQRVVL